MGGSVPTNGTIGFDSVHPWLNFPCLVLVLNNCLEEGFTFTAFSFGIVLISSANSSNLSSLCTGSSIGSSPHASFLASSNCNIESPGSSVYSIGSTGGNKCLLIGLGNGEYLLFEVDTAMAEADLNEK